MATYDVNDTANTVFGIAGTGIGLGLLAGTAMNINKMTGRMYGTQYYKYNRVPARRYTLAKPMQMRTQGTTPRLSIRPRVQRRIGYQRNPYRWW